MPGPEPDGVDCYQTDDGRWHVLTSVWPKSGFWAMGNRKHRLARGKAVLRNLRWGGWCCRECGDAVPLWRRADAVYCSTSCRKRAQRRRKK